MHVTPRQRLVPPVLVVGGSGEGLGSPELPSDGLVGLRIDPGDIVVSNRVLVG